MDAILVVVRSVVAEQTAQMEFVEYDDVIKQLAAYRAYPSLCDPVLPWATQGSWLMLDAEVFNHPEDSAREDRVIVMDQELDRRLTWERIAKLLDHPRSRRMLGDVEMKNFAPAVGDHEPDVEHLEANRRNDQEVHGRDHVAMVSKECGPSLPLVIASISFWEVTRHGCNADRESQLLELGLDSSRTPRILAGEAMNKLAKLRRDGRSSGSSRRDRPPVAPKALAMPSDHGLGSDNDERRSPSGPNSEKGNPESAIQRGQARARMFVGVHRELLTKRQLDDRLFTLIAKQGWNRGDEDCRKVE